MVDESVEIERVYVIPLRKAKRGKSSNAAPKAMKLVQGYLTRHMKVDDEKIWIDESLNQALWSQGKYTIPSKIRVRAVKFDDGVVEASLPELGFKKSRRELLKEEREKKEPILRRETEEEEAEAGEGVAGAEDFEIAPTADGEVKIKKKKAPKKKEPEEKPAAKKKKEKKSKKPKKAAEKKEKKPAAAQKKTPAKKSAKTAKKKPVKKPAKKK